MESRQNVVETYLGLALAARGVKADVRPEWTWVTGISTVSFCNFVARFNLTRSQVDKALPMFAEFGAKASSFWMFATDYENPSDLTNRFLDAGFDLRQTLQQIAWDRGPRMDSVPGEEARSLPERLLVARFMTDTFFNRTPADTRNLVTDATANCKHRLFSWRDGQGIAAAVMVSETTGCYGLYNLCVRQDVRERGYGTEAVGFVQSLAADENRAVVLQCQPDLVDWYEKRGFDPVGELRAFGVPHSIRS
ncbi:MAG: GNAT family N-acetyltransferase [bacterium]